MMKRNRKHASTPAERVQNHRARVAAAGGRRLEVMLDESAAKALDQLHTQHGGTLRDCINELLMMSAAGRRQNGGKK